MAKYLFVGNYGPEGLQGLIKEGGTGRRDAVEKLAQSVGGSVESFYYALGADDVFVVCDLPDDEAAAAVGLTVGASGQVSLRTVVLMSPEQVDEAAQRSPIYRPPGG